MAENALYTRFAERRLTEALEDSPVTLIHGPRQCGKTTLALMVCAPEQLTSGNRPSSVLPAGSPSYGYLTFDDVVTRESAETDPMGFIADIPERVILDEAQRVPGLFAALKVAVDRRRVPGRFLLTGGHGGRLSALATDGRLGEACDLLKRYVDWYGPGSVYVELPRQGDASSYCGPMASDDHERASTMTGRQAASPKVRTSAASLSVSAA